MNYYNNLISDVKISTKSNTNYWLYAYCNKKRINYTISNNAFINYTAVFDIFFLKKEKVYTKLKYSRVPQYDIVSGGVAAIFSGFLGFLICEKFGFELLDSGDFYYLFIYVVFLCFILRVFLKLISYRNDYYNPFSLKLFTIYFKTLFYLIKNLYK